MSTGERGRMPALDGVRGLAILLVVQQHVTAGLVPALSYSGPVGVTVFFVLSGYLITGILLRESANTGRLNLRRFYLRRAARLLPALVVVIAAALVIYGPPALGDVGLAGLYGMDFAVAAGHAPMALGHTWSLAVEEQFYMLWPLVLMVAVRRHRPTVAIAALFGVAVAWRVAATLLFSMDRVYFAPDTNAFALLLGCLLASLERDGRLPRLGRGAAVSAGVALVLLPYLPKIPNGIQWSGLVAAALAGVLIVAVRNAGRGWLTSPVMRWFGSVSYGWYLWHGLLVWLAPGLAGRLLLAAVSLGIAALSWRYVEQPFLRRRSVRVISDPVSRPLIGEVHAAR